MQAQAVFHDHSVLILDRWSFCQSLNRDSAILLQAQNLVTLTKCRIYSKDLISSDPNVRINNLIEVHWDKNLLNKISIVNRKINWLNIYLIS